MPDSSFCKCQAKSGEVTIWLLLVGGGGRMHIVYTIILYKMAQLLDGGNIEL